MSSNEKELLLKAKNGHIESFELLIEGIKIKAYNIAFRYMKNEEDAKDVLQDSLIKIYKGLNNFNEDSGFSTWVYRIVVNTCLDYIKKNKKHEHVANVYENQEGEESMLEIPDVKNSPEIVLENKQNSSDILECLNMLSDKYREVIILRDIQGFSYEEIAGMIHCSEGALKSRLNRGRANLKELILKKRELNS